MPRKKQHAEHVPPVFTDARRDAEIDAELDATLANLRGEGPCPFPALGRYEREVRDVRIERVKRRLLAAIEEVS